MSADVWIERKACDKCGRGEDRSADLNFTYNLSSMLREAGFNGWRWCVGKRAPKVGRHILTILDGMQVDPEHWRAMNPSNGWGDYDVCIQGRMRAWAMECLTASDEDHVGGWL